MGDEHLRLGAILLELVCDWDAWVSRRVDSFYFAGDDERVLHRRQSIDFTLPDSLAAADRSLLKRYGGYPLPITFVSKWRLPEFSLRGSSDNTVSLLQRDDSVPLAAAMLVALGTFVKSGETTVLPEPGSPLRMPAALQEEMRKIAAGEPQASLRRCVEFQHTELADAGEIAAWREALAGSELFMSLAYELANGFLLTAVVPIDSHTRQVLKFSYNSYVVPAERDHRLIRANHLRRWIRNHSRDAVDPVWWGRSSSLLPTAKPGPPSSRTGHLVLSTTCDGASEQLRHGAPSIACALATIEGPDRRQNVRIRPSGVVSLAGLTPGRYEIAVKDHSGFWVEPRRLEFEVGRGELIRRELRVRRVRFPRREMRAAPAIAAVSWRGKEISRAFGWSSRPLVIRVRLGGGGSYHCEFEAPPGLHVTRGRLISNLDGNEAGEDNGDGARRRRARARYVDTALESTQRAHLYQPAHAGDPATGYVFLNLRPRVETIVRPATFTAFLTVGILGFLAWLWNFPPKGFDGSDPPLALLALVLGGPSALAAYFAQAVPSRVTNALMYGVRLLAMLPAAMSVLAAAAILRRGADAGFSLILLASISLVAFVALMLTYRFAEHPREQKPRGPRQGPDFDETHLAPFEGGGRVPAPASEPAASDERPEAIRDRMLERTGGLTGATRRKLLWQRSFFRWEREVPPALYFDSAETPAVFLGPTTAAEREKLQSCLEALSAGRSSGASNPVNR